MKLYKAGVKKASKILLLSLFIFSVLLFGYSTVVHYSGATHVIEMNAERFSPSQIQILQGDTVVFKNIDSFTHWPASNFHPTHAAYPGSDIRRCGSLIEEYVFDACEPIPPNGKYTFTFREPGFWNFHDHLSLQSSGTVVVNPNSEYVGSVIYHITKAVRYFLHAIIRTESNTIPGLASIRSGSEGLLLGTVLDKEDLFSDKNYEAERVYHYAPDDIEIRRVVFQIGPRRTIEKISEESGEGSNFSCHSAAHYVGRAAYDVFGKEILKDGSSACHSGFYHGFIEAFFWEVGSGSFKEELNALCTSLKVPFERNQCFHGAGHGLMAFLDYDLPKALSACRSFSEKEKTDFCYGGVFMENVTTALGFSAGINGHYTNWVSTDNLYYPCDTVEDHTAKRKCYQMQTSWMFAVVTRDYQEVIDVCLGAEEGFVDACFNSIGRDTSSNTLRNAQEVERTCSLMPRAYYKSCIIGAFDAAFDYWGVEPSIKVSSFCVDLGTEESSAICFERYINRIAELYSTEKTQTALCATMPDKYKEECLNDAKEQ
ncbi:MAG: hypothetical protein ACJKTH_03870 [Patescibacteria group bacterium UBA2163]